MANGPLGGNMGTPPVPPQPPQVSFETTAQSRGNFNNFLKSIPPTTALTPLPPMGSTPMMPTPMPPMGGNPMANIDIFNQPMGMMGMNQPPMNPMMQPPMQQQPMNIGMMQQPMMMADGGNVAPRQAEIMGQPHMLAYITPEEGGILKALGGSGAPGPMGIPSFFGPGGPGDDGTDPGDSGTGGDNGSDNNDDGQEDTSDSYGEDMGTDPGGNANEGGGEFSDTDAMDDMQDYSPVGDDDIDYTDVDYGYTTQDTDTGKDDMDRATEIGQAISQAQANAAEIQNRALAARNKQNVQAAINQNKANQQSLVDAQLSLAPSKSGTTTTGKTSGSMPGGPPTSNVQAASTTNFSNIGAKGDDDPLGLSLQGVGLGPSISTPSISSVSPTSGPNTNADITGFGSSRDKSDFSTDIDALADVEEQAKKGSFPNLDKVPGTLGFVTGLINAATKRGAQNTIDNISKGYAPTYSKDGSITGTTNYGIGMGQPSSDKQAGEGFGMAGGFFGGGRSVDGYDVFDKTSPSLGMYDDNEIGGDESENPLILRKLIAKPIEEEDDGDKPPNVIGGGDPITPPASGPVVVDSPYTSNVGDYTPVGFSSGDLNKLIAAITGVAAPQSMAQGGIAKFQNGGRVMQALDNLLATG